MSRIRDLSKWFLSQPLARKFGMELVRLEEGLAEVRYASPQEDCVTNDDGQHIVQGGVVGGVLADFAAVLAAMSVLPSGHTPLLCVSFSLQRPTLAGEEVVAVARVFNKGGTILSVEVQISGANNKLKCKGDYLFTRPKQ